MVYASSTTLAITPTTASTAQTITLTATVKTATGTPTGAGVPTGTVTFYDSNSPVPLGSGSIPLNSSHQAVLTLTGASLGVGTQSIYALYSGNGTSFAPSQSASVTETVLSGTTIALSSSGTFVSGTTTPTYTSDFSQPIALTAVVTPGVAGTTLSGTVTFKDTTTGTILASNVPVTFNGTNYVAIPATTFAALTVRSHTITATYTPAAGEPTAGSAATMYESVTADATTTTLTTSSGTTNYGETATFTATIANAPGTAAPLGTVSFKDTTNFTAVTLGSAKVVFNSTNNDYEATFADGTLAVGTHSITAYFTPTNTTDFAKSNGSTTQTVGQVATTTTVTSSLNPSAVGQTVTLTATIAPVAGTAIATGYVQFYVDGAPQGSPIHETTGVATLPLSGLVFGSYTISATYTTDKPADFTNSDNTANPYVQSVFNATQTTLQATTNNAFAGDMVTFTATVTALSDPNGQGTPTGNVAFFDNGVEIAGSPASLDGNGVAVFTTDTLPAGKRTITAEYLGDGSYYAASTATTTVTIYAVPASIAVALIYPYNHVIIPGGPFTLRSLIYDSAGNRITTQPPGSVATVTIYQGRTPGGTVVSTSNAAFVSGRFVFANLRVRSGTYVAVVTYDGVSTSYLINANTRIS